MVDVIPADVRSRMMSNIRTKHTKPEQTIRKGLHGKGFRFRLHNRKLPGSPDLVLARYRAVIFVNGCFWHAHNCHLFRLPATRTYFWKEKFEENRMRDQAAIEQLQEYGWRIAIVWECALKGKCSMPVSAVVEELGNWLHGQQSTISISGSTK